MAAIQGQYHRRRHIRGAAEHHRQARAWPAGLNPMALVLSEEARMVRETALDFFRERSPITALRKLRDDNDPVGFSRDLWRQMAELGWTGFLVPEDDGGSAFGMTGLAQVMEAAGRTLAATPLMSTGLLGASLLALGGTEEQKAH